MNYFALYCVCCEGAYFSDLLFFSHTQDTGCCGTITGLQGSLYPIVFKIYIFKKIYICDDCILNKTC